MLLGLLYQGRLQRRHGHRYTTPTEQRHRALKLPDGGPEGQLVHQDGAEQFCGSWEPGRGGAARVVDEDALPRQPPPPSRPLLLLRGGGAVAFENWGCRSLLLVLVLVLLDPGAGCSTRVAARTN